ncbi:MAG: efflux RND transporter periplasmic adaptor subunit, partial [Pseudomonadales bacterium]
AQSRLQSAQAALKELDVAREQAELNLRRTRELAARKLASQADLDRDTLAVESVAARLDRAGQEVNVAGRGVAVQQELLEDMEIRAPFDGVVVAKAAQPGEMISPISAGGGFTRTGICTIVDMDSLEVEVDVNEAYINRVRQGQPVQVSLNAYPDDHYAARVIAIIPTADRSKATVRVRVGFVDRDERVLPDMGVRVAFLDESERREPAEATGVLVPKSSVATDEQGDYVFLVRNDRIARRAVVAGEDIGRRVRVVSGLAPGEQVVVNPVAGIADGLSDGVRVSVAGKESRS